MASSKKNSGRKPLRQRVADRKAGRVELTPEDEKRLRLYKRLGFFGSLLQGTGLVLLLFAIGRYVASDFQTVSWNMVIIYSGIFLVGRGLLMVVTIYRSSKR